MQMELFGENTLMRTWIGGMAVQTLGFPFLQLIDTNYAPSCLKI
jgi:hypothetical protein